MHNFATSKYWKAQLAELPDNNLLHTMMELDRVPAWLWEWVGEPDYDGTFFALLERFSPTFSISATFCSILHRKTFLRL